MTDAFLRAQGLPLRDCCDHALVLDRILSSADPQRLIAADMRIRELEEMVERMNRTRPHAVAVEVCREVAAMDPRDVELRCFFCFAAGEQHEQDCVWSRAGRVSKWLQVQETAHVVGRYRGKAG